MDGLRDFTSFLTVFQSYQDDVWMIMIGCVQWEVLRNYQERYQSYRVNMISILKITKGNNSAKRYNFHTNHKQNYKGASNRKAGRRSNSS